MLKSMNQKNNKVIRMSQSGLVYQVQSSVDKDVYYVVNVANVSINRGDEIILPLFCSCPDFIIRGGEKNPNHVCKHMRMVTEAEENKTVITKENSVSWRDDEYGF